MILKRVFKDGEFLKEMDNDPPKYRGRKLTFDDLENMISQQIVIKSATCSHTWYKVVRVTEMVQNDTSYEGFHRRLVYCDKPKPRKGDNCYGYVSEYWTTVEDPVMRSEYYALNNKIPKRRNEK